MLEANLSRFPKERWTRLQAALSDAEASGSLQLNRDNRGASRLVAGPAEGTVQVPMLPAGSVLGSLERLDIMKIDIEGHEEAVFRAASDTLARLKPRAILFEDELGKAHPEGAIGSVLNACGYRVFGLRKTLTATTLELVTQASSRVFHDYVAVSRTRPLPRRAVRRYGL